MSQDPILLELLADTKFDQKEAQVYLALLELGQTTVSRIAQKSGIKRTTIYLSLENLMKKGLITTFKVGNKALYYAEDPRSLERLAEEQKDRISKMMPQLLAFTNLIDKKPKIRYFEGTEGIKDAYRDTLNYRDQETLAWASQEAVKYFDSDWLTNVYLPKRVEKKIWQRTIAPDNPEIRNFTDKDQIHLRQTRFIPKDQMPLEVEINLYGKQNIAVMSFEEKIGLIIESKKIYNTLKSIFEMNWKMLE